MTTSGVSFPTARLRVLRDNASLTRQAYVEFDLETMMDGGEHLRRLRAALASVPSVASRSRTPGRVLAGEMVESRPGTGHSCASTGSVTVSRRRSPPWDAASWPTVITMRLRDNLRSGRSMRRTTYRQLLRLVYRLLFLFVAEDRELLHDPTAEAVCHHALQEILRHGDRLRKLAEPATGSRHVDLYRCFGW